MSWETKDSMSLKIDFISLYLEKKHTVTELCLLFKITRKTGHKWIERYKEDEDFGLFDKSKRPLISPNKTCDEMVKLIIDTRNKYKWGGRKLRQFLINAGHTNLPCEKTFNRILKQNELIEDSESEKREHFIRFEKELPNELWQMDFKGHFKIETGRCHPLTVLDDHSRYSICLTPCYSEDETSVRNALENAFRMYGLPDAMTMDNGSPWKGEPPCRLSGLTVWLMRLGIKVGHSAPYHPQTQGKLERFHRSFKAEVLKYNQLRDLPDCVEKFEEWREIYNYLRPHEGIGLLVPADRYKPSLKKYPEILEPIEYRTEDEIRRVGQNGIIEFKGVKYYIGEHLRKQEVALRQYKEDIYDVYFCTTKIRRIKMK